MDKKDLFKKIYRCFQLIVFSFIPGGIVGVGIFSFMFYWSGKNWCLLAISIFFIVLGIGLFVKIIKGGILIWKS